MTTLEERIRDLEAEIADYRQEYANASPEEKKELRPLITARGNNLHDLYLQQQQSQAQAGGGQAQPGGGGQGQDSEPDWQSVQSCLIRFNNTLTSGQGVVVSPSLVMTALHGSFEIGDQFEVSSTKKKLTLVHQWFESEKVDIALLQLHGDGEDFPTFLDVLVRDVRRQERVTVLSLQSGMGGAYDFATQPATIYMFDTNTTLCRAQYYAEDGLSGSGVITEIEADGKVKVIGVHVLAHDSTEPSKPIERATKKSRAADFESVSSNSDTMARNIHGHTAYCMICVASKVPDLMEIIQKSNQEHVQMSK